MLLNLVGNAIDACGTVATAEAGHVEVQIHPRSEAVDFLVLDNGPGVEPGMEQAIFEAFVTTKTVGEGTGLGLAVARRLTAANQGELTYERQSGRTCFRLSVPSPEV